jgi:hypothetical protein
MAPMTAAKASPLPLRVLAGVFPEKSFSVNLSVIEDKWEEMELAGPGAVGVSIVAEKDTKGFPSGL